MFHVKHVEVAAAPEAAAALFGRRGWNAPGDTPKSWRAPVSSAGCWVRGRWIDCGSGTY